MRKIVGLALCAVLAVAVPFVLAAGCGGGSAAEALEQRLADALDFEDGAVVQGAPPAGEAGSGAPQVSGFSGPGELRLGETFSLTVRTDFQLYADVDKVLVQVDGADSYVQVTGGVLPENGQFVMRLSGRLDTRDTELQGEEFTVNVAFQTKLGRTGQYFQWKVGVSEEEPIEQGVDLLSGVTLPGEQASQDAKPAPHSGTEYPQVNSVSIGLLQDRSFIPRSLPSVTVGETFQVMVFSETARLVGEQVNVRMVVVAAPGGRGHKATQQFMAVPMGSQGYRFDFTMRLTDETLAGRTIVLLFGLMDLQNMVGSYYPLEIVVASTPAVDGDIPVDGDAMIDGDAAVDGDTSGQRLECGADAMGDFGGMAAGQCDQRIGVCENAESEGSEIWYPCTDDPDCCCDLDNPFDPEMGIYPCQYDSCGQDGYCDRRCGQVADPDCLAAR